MCILFFLDFSGKIEAFHRCKKRAYQYALQNAFSKVLLVVLSNGKVFAEINTNIMESQEELKLDNNYLTVSYFNAYKLKLLKQD